MQTRQLVVIPPNQTCQSRRITTMSNDRYEEMLASSLVEPSHWVHGMEAIVDQNMWPQFGFTSDWAGNPVLDPDVAKSVGSVARADHERRELQKMKVSQIDDDPSVGEMKARMEKLEAMIMDQAASSAKKDAQIAAEAIAEYKKQVDDFNLAGKTEVPSSPEPKEEVQPEKVTEQDEPLEEESVEEPEVSEKKPAKAKPKPKRSSTKKES